MNSEEDGRALYPFLRVVLAALICPVLAVWPGVRWAGVPNAEPG
jgi:hypothetical protein